MVLAKTDTQASGMEWRRQKVSHKYNWLIIDKKAKTTQWSKLIILIMMENLDKAL